MLMRAPLYLATAAAPFVQEDAAVFGAAAAAAARLGEPVWLFTALMVGLVASDTWKYWAGRLAAKSPSLARIADKPAVNAAKAQVLNRLGVSLLIARFVPGTRVPLYLASGFFGAPFLPFFFYVVLSGLIYAGVAFVVVAWLGALAGERLFTWLAIGAAAAVVIALTTFWLRRRRRSRAA